MSNVAPKATPAPARAGSVALAPTPRMTYLLRLADTALILSHRLAEWCGRGPIVEEDMAMTNIALDLVGQARALLTHVGAMDGHALDEDQLAFLRDERDFRNPTIVELPRGDFAFTMLRVLLVGAWLEAHWRALAESSGDDEVRAIAAKALKEARYHVRHAADWIERLADGTPESRRRVERALAELWRFTPELFDDDDADRAAAAAGLGPTRASRRGEWNAAIGAVFAPLGLVAPAPSAFRSSGMRGVHSEHLGYLLAEMQHLQRTYPGGAW